MSRLTNTRVRVNATVRVALCCASVVIALGATAPPNPTAEQLVAGAIDLTRGLSSYAQLKMTIHRPEWERSSTLKAWTKGRGEALIRFVAPARDAGNATLKQGDNMWTFTPKLNRVVRLPFSMMSQSWAGSDLSYKDLSRTDDLLKYYDLELTGTEELEGHTVFTIVALPHDDAPIVWGKEVMRLRDDYVLLSQTFFDQSAEPKALKRLEALDVGDMGGRTFATRMRMTDLEEGEHWTELEYLEARFDVELADSLFTVFSLESGKEP